MPNLSIKHVPQEWAEALRQRAARNHRSLQRELMALVERAVAEEASSAGGDPRGQPRAVGYDRHGHPIARVGWKTPEQVFEEMRKKYPEPILGQPLGRDTIRADRDSR